MEKTHDSEAKITIDSIRKANVDVSVSSFRTQTTRIGFHVHYLLFTTSDLTRIG